MDEQVEIPEKQDSNRNPDGTFKAGVVANPNGRPKKGNAWADIENELLSAAGIKLEITNIVIDKDTGAPLRQVSKIDLAIGESKTIRHAITIRQIQLALSGDNVAINNLKNYDIGMPKQSVNHTNNGDKFDSVQHVWNMVNPDTKAKLEELEKSANEIAAQ